MFKALADGFRSTFGGSAVAAQDTLSMGGTWTPLSGVNVQTQSGETVSEVRALTLPAVFCAVWNISNHLSMLKLGLYKRDGKDDREVLRDDPRHQMMNLAANDDMTAISARSASHVHSLLWGNSISEIVRDGRRRIVGFVPLDPDRVRIMRKRNRLMYEYRQPDGTMDTLYGEDVIHVPGMSGDGVCGYPLIRMLARENIGLQLAIEGYARSFFGNGVSVGTIFKYPGQLTPEVRKERLEHIRREYASPANRGKPFLADGGIEIERDTQTNKDALLVESLTYSIGDVARWLNVPPHFLKEMSRATFSNIEHQEIEYVKYTLQPWIKRYEQELCRKLLTPAEMGTHYFEHDVNTLLRGDIKTRVEFYKLLSERGLSPNAILRLENLPSIGEAGDQHLVQMNMTTLEQMLQDRENESQKPPTESPTLPPTNDDEPPTGDDTEDDDEQAMNRAEKLFGAIHEETYKRIAKRASKQMERGKALDKVHADMIDAATSEMFLVADGLCQLFGVTEFDVNFVKAAAYEAIRDGNGIGIEGSFNILCRQLMDCRKKVAA